MNTPACLKEDTDINRYFVLNTVNVESPVQFRASPTNRVVVQLVEFAVWDREVAGSSPVYSTMNISNVINKLTEECPILSEKEEWDIEDLIEDLHNSSYSLSVIADKVMRKYPKIYISHKKFVELLKA